MVPRAYEAAPIPCCPGAMDHFVIWQLAAYGWLSLIDRRRLARRTARVVNPVGTQQGALQHAMASTRHRVCGLYS